ncbi:N-terminal C2 in EEIG1 and EHBP1 proteins-domain-containing protein [Mycotypha africana]|uniref:N-terminal C2 in EEIG1 and EHBP1 proteins-domain-containing protein n=1 Tax=Mycotypha africana TaxID=64632 RepID=UPI002301A695|nr:N-terminal C2 in EEIG1 and EHBP1 proteins-domain-containing protein [Mycotypha africana]KAI8971684.1 N-terminal C2 in EEIG1 and EHBP1 proteins-domain-containing protein [Mycotypha africana]
MSSLHVKTVLLERTDEKGLSQSTLMFLFSHLPVSKYKKFKFEIQILIRELLDVPLLSGYYYVDWKLRNASDAFGTTRRIHIRNHNVVWNCLIKTMLSIAADKKHTLRYSELRMDIFKEGNRQKLGTVSVNMSEFVGKGYINERYLLKNCRFNSTIKLSIRINLTTESMPSCLQLSTTSNIDRKDTFNKAASQAAIITHSPRLKLISPSFRSHKQLLTGGYSNNEILRETIKEHPMTVFAMPCVATAPDTIGYPDNAIDEDNPDPYHIVDKLFATIREVV